MRKPVLTIFYQFNPWNPTIGGIQALVRYFIKYTPSDFTLRFVGTSSDASTPIGQWQPAELEGRSLQFMPLFYLENDNIKQTIPTSVRYTQALMGKQLESDFMHFYRLEPTLATRNWQGEKTLFIQNDILQQVAASGDKNAILWRRFPQAYFILERLLVKQFDYVLSCNSESMKLYQERYPEIAHRVSYFHNVFDGEVFYPLSAPDRESARKQLAQRLNLAEDTRFVLFAGRLHPQKDPLLLIDSFAALKQPNVHLLIVGDGDLAEAVRERIAQQGLTNRVTLLGALQQSAVADLHRLASACILTSAYEGMPFVALEALACGTPLVTTHCGETPSLLTATSGVITPDRTPDAIAQSLEQVLNHPHQYPAQACAQVAQPYNARHVVHAVCESMLHRWAAPRVVHSAA
ncbi:MAG: glycosyltransferase family 4 protein [Oculatellaceae cyanobacterium Prado106]|nr:glycosyltransferase family 4 protein [Oculatellaceae cyanobacterium Prado106]